MAPLSVKAVGLASLLVHVPCQPTVTFPPGLIVESYETFVALTASPLCVTVALQALVTFWSPG